MIRRLVRMRILLQALLLVQLNLSAIGLAGSSFDYWASRRYRTNNDIQFLQSQEIPPIEVTIKKNDDIGIT